MTSDRKLNLEDAKIPDLLNRMSCGLLTWATASMLGKCRYQCIPIFQNLKPCGMWIFDKL